MSVWSDPVFVISAITIFVGFMKFVVSYLYKSKCENFALCWGMFTVHRNIQLEIEAERIDADLGHPHAEV